MSTVAIKWMQEQSRLFACRDSLGNTVMSGSWSATEESGLEWKAAKPSDLLLMGLASCAAHDVVAISASDWVPGEVGAPVRCLLGWSAAC